MGTGRIIIAIITLLLALLLIVTVVWSRRRQPQALESNPDKPEPNLNSTCDDPSPPEPKLGVDDHHIVGDNYFPTQQSITNRDQADLSFDAPHTEQQGQQAVTQQSDPGTQTQSKNTRTTAIKNHAILVVHVMAPRSQFFTGADILEALQQQHLQFGEHNIFHAYDSQGHIQFSVASATEPGTFDDQHLEHFTTPGLGFFTDIRHVAQPRAIFKHMLATAHQVAQRLQGELLDHRRQRLTASTVSEYLAQIKATELAQNHAE